jgi:hypothetical protein
MEAIRVEPGKLLERERTNPSSELEFGSNDCGEVGSMFE